MDNSLKDLENQLGNLVPRAQSESGRESCHALLDELVATCSADSAQSSSQIPWLSTGLAAAVALGLGIGGGLYLSNDQPEALASNFEAADEEFSASFDQLNRESWMVTSDYPGVYVSKDGEIREISQETEVTKEVIKHRQSGFVVTVETTDHHLVDSLKNEF